ncbi:MAG: GreA/GreB family elongation factor [Lachnospiraceae bacterium]|nr:GreA/GreB family elongation factor [Lachnospiraceae bacterium]
MDIQKLTKKDVEKIEEEIRKRKLEIRPKALEDVKTARAQGDLSENFEYYAAKKFNRENNSRIEYLEKMLKNAVIIDDVDDVSTEDVVNMDDYVTVLFFEANVDDADMDSEVYKLVTSIRADSMKKKISIESPLGKAMIGKKIGDIATVSLENGSSYKIKIKDIKKNDDSEEDDIKQF